MLASPYPPMCPLCPHTPVLWKDTGNTRPGHPDWWHWYCAGCGRKFPPTDEQKKRFT